MIIVDNYIDGIGNAWQTSSPYSTLNTSQKYEMSGCEDFEAI